MADYKPRDYQQEAVNKTLDYIAKGGRAGLICLPTGTGKAGQPALILREMFKRKPFTRALMLTHRKTLIEQNHATLRRIWPDAPCGIFSAGLKRRDKNDAITYAGIQSIHRHAETFGHIDLVIVDEAHLISENAETMYGKFLAELRATNPALALIGMTATPFRLKSGMLVDGPMFDDIIVDRTLGDNFTWFVDEGYLVDVHAKDVDERMDTKGVRKAGGEFVIASLAEKFNRTEVSEKIVAEVARRRGSRRCGITFAINIEHAEELTRIYNDKGIPATTAHSQMDDDEAEARVKAFVAGEYEMLVDVERFTTGFDCPHIDLIVMARPTESSGLWVQMLGRGTRPVYAGGHDLATKEGRLAAIAASRKPAGCLVLDFAANSLRLGPINAPITAANKAKKTADGTVLAPVKCCPECRELVHAATRYCVCGYEFKRGEEVTMSGEIIPGVLIRRSGVREDRLYPVDRHSVKIGKTMTGKSFVLLSIWGKGLDRPVNETFYMTSAAYRYNEGQWNVLMPNGPPFPYDLGLADYENAEVCKSVLDEGFAASKMIVWTNHVAMGKVSPKIVEVG